jgi:hypothetical protein
MFCFLSFCFVYLCMNLGTLMLCAYIFRIVIPSCWIISFISMQWDSLCLLTDFCVKICFVCYENGFSCLLLVSACLINLFQPFTSSLWVSLVVRCFLVDNRFLGLAFSSNQTFCIFWFEAEAHLHLGLLLRGTYLLLYFYWFFFSSLSLFLIVLYFWLC